MRKLKKASLPELLCDRCHPSSLTFNTFFLLFVLLSRKAPTKPTLQQLLNQWRRRYSTFEELEEEVTRQIANSSEIEYFKLSFQEITTCFDLLDTLADDLAAFSTQEAQDCLNTASTLRKRKCDLLINVRKYEKVLTNDGLVSTRSNSPLRVQGTSTTASVPLRSSNTTESLANNFISTTAADVSFTHPPTAWVHST